MNRGESLSGLRAAEELNFTKWPLVVDSRQNSSLHGFWADTPSPSATCSPLGDSPLFIAPLTLWPSGQGVGLLSRWGLPAWARIPQVSLAQPPAALQPCVCGHAGQLPALRPTACLQLPSASNELVTGRRQSWKGAISHSAALQRQSCWFLIGHHLTLWPSG